MTEADPAKAPPLRGTMIRGTLWMVAMKWVVRLIGFANTAVLVRLLGPTDFGIIAMGTLVIGLLEVFLDFGVEAILIQLPEAMRQHWDTAWTVRVLQAALVAALILVATPFAVSYYDEPRVAWVLPFLTLGVIFQAFENIGMVAFRRNLDFRRDFAFMLLRKVITVAVVIGLALTLRNYWALAIGTVAGRALFTLLSYLAHPYRPRFSFAAMRDMWAFSQWLIVLNLGQYLLSRIDELIVGGTTSPKDLGTYSVSSELAELPTSEVVTPMMRVLFPGFSRLQNEPDRLVASYLAVLGVTAVLGTSVGFGLSLVAEYVVPLIFGEKWLAGIPILEVLGLYGAIRMIYWNVGSVLLATGKMRLLAAFTWVQVIVLPVGLWLAIRYGGIWELTITKTGLALVFCLNWFVVLVRYMKIRPRALVRVIYRPLIAGVTMLVLLAPLKPFFPGGVAGGLLCTMILGAVVFTATLLGLWSLAGSPKGAERFILDTLSALVVPTIRRILRRR